MLWSCRLSKCTLKDWNGNPCTQKYLIQKCLVDHHRETNLEQFIPIFFISNDQSERIHDKTGNTAAIAFQSVFVYQAEVSTKALSTCQNRVKNKYIYSFDCCCTVLDAQNTMICKLNDILKQQLCFRLIHCQLVAKCIHAYIITLRRAQIQGELQFKLFDARPALRHCKYVYIVLSDL